MALYIRPLSIQNLDQCEAVESAAFPPAEAASRAKIEYRLTVCPEICVGLFARAGSSVPSKQEGSIPFLEEPQDTTKDILIAHIISTRSTSRTVIDENMVCPSNWKSDPKGEPGVGHIPSGRTIALHSLAVSPTHQKSGFGKAIMNAYIEYIRGTGQADRVSILTYDRLVSYYQNLGYSHYGKSDCTYAGVAWHDLAYEFNPGA